MIRHIQFRFTTLVYCVIVLLVDCYLRVSEQHIPYCTTLHLKLNSHNAQKFFSLNAKESFLYVENGKQRDCMIARSLIVLVKQRLKAAI
ncbi:CLUMA_CG007897, isoform A [Clunio marinus]|uniref:CLUMA_CG007897, isoform A n=1 Tax=Clunio marinus TaxID=568069 RepID=A0A1J1I623_9DIPT|nr:CLUMA_CG007897, isoform A [Clunio marinus]